jgi:phosphatidylserine/phosphatidylglycerophosphate/cardiolipin synthase-like enzyme
MQGKRVQRWLLIGGAVLLIALAAVFLLSRMQSAQPVAPAQAAPLPVTTAPLELLAMPEAGSAPLLQAIDNAQTSIRLKIYLITSDAVVEGLARAVQRGVATRVLIEEEPYGGEETNALAAQALRDAGVQVRARPGAFVYSHEKSMVVDDSRAFLMTHNLTRSSFERNREYAVIVDDPAVVEEVARVFDADWERVEPDLSQAQLVWSPVNSRQRIAALIDSAEVSLDVQHTSLQDPALISQLADAARRGVRVRVTTPAIYDPGESEYGAIDELFAAGVAIRFLDDPYVHAKVIVADGRLAMVGSQNLTTNSLENNRELGVIFNDAAAVNRLAGYLLRDWNSAKPWAGPQPTATLPAGGILSWDQVAGYVGQTVTVEGDVIDTYDSGKVTFLNFDEDRTLTVVIFASAYPDFPQAPADLYWRKRVRVSGQVELYQERPEIIVESPDAIEIVADLLARDGQPTATAPASGVIGWQDAGQYLGQRLTVEGDVLRVHNSGKAAFLNFAEEYRGKFSVVIFAADFDQWPEPPDQVYLGQRVRVSGKIKEYQGAPEMVVESPEQIVIVGPAATATPAATAAERSTTVDLETTVVATITLPISSTASTTPIAIRTPAATATPQPVIAWQEAAAYDGQEVTVEGVVVDSYKSDKVIFLNFSDDRSQFKAVIFQRDWSKWPQSAEQMLLGATVRVSGPIQLYEGAPEIIVEDPAQIAVLAQPAAALIPVAPPSAPIPWQEAAAYKGQRVTVEGVVVDTYKSDKVIFLNFSPNRSDFKIVIFASAWDRWPQAPDELYYGQRLLITGEVQLYNGAPEIIVDGPEQIVVIGEP